VIEAFHLASYDTVHFFREFFLFARWWSACIVVFMHGRKTGRHVSNARVLGGS